MRPFQLITREDIDPTQWDNCVQAANGLIYAKSFFLNKISPGWCALTGENYDWVLPLISNKKLGISYLYQPPFSQQFGLYSKPGAEVPFNEIINWLKKQYRFWEINWNAATTGLLKDETITKNQAANFILDLSNEYETIAQNYHNDLAKNLKKCRQFLFKYQPSESYENCIDLYVEYYAGRTPNVTQHDYNNFKKLCHFAQQKNMLICRDAINEDRKILSTALFLFDGKRLYNMMNTTTNEGRKMSSNHFLIDSIIREFAGQKIIFDFEGSDLPGVKPFYENFGAINEPYFHIKHNHLPWPVRLFKR